MDGKIKKLDGTDPYIWLRYTTEFTTNGLRQTVEMGIPMPVGASEEEREQLLREAEAGMGQLISHTERRIPQMLQQARSRPQGASVPPAAAAPKPTGASFTPTTPVSPTPGLTRTPPTPAANTPPMPRPASAPPVAETPPPPAPKPVVRPAAIAAPQTTTQSPQAAVPSAPEIVRETPHMGEPISPTAPKTGGIGMSMPRSSLPVSDGSGNLKLPDFISYIREHFELTPKQAMNMLNVKTLSDINLREAIEQLRKLVGPKNTGAPVQNDGKREQDEENIPTPRPAFNPASIPSLPPSVQLNPSGARSNAAPNNAPKLREERPRIFDEEVGPEEGDLDDLADLDEPYEMMARERDVARTVLTRLRARGGSTQASPARLQVLKNVTDGQVSEAQLLELVEGAWSVTVLKKLKVEQVEELISWAKEDNFVNEAEAVLALLEEE
ncbi:MAG TPA: hypothetical protein VKR06_33955 [Ktedonosporobacter sp.]|nr:hypothetical protein [Ktedonosporobacter sp.]